MMNDSNCTDCESQSVQLEYYIYAYVLPVIVFVGLCGNITSIFLITVDKQMRNVSSSVYLASVLAADTGMLLSLLLTWLETLGYPLNHQPAVCRIYVYMTYVCGFLSIWYVVCITVETYITICHPTKIKHMCTLFRARTVTAALLLTSLALYAISPIINKVQVVSYPHYNITREICMAIPKYQQHNIIVSYIDTVLTLLVPFIALIVLLALMTLEIMRSVQRKQKRTMVKKNAENGAASNTRKLPQVRVAKMLYILSLSVVILNAPSHGFRLKAMFAGTNRLQGVESLLYLILLFVSYCSFSAKFFICLIFSKNFRKLFQSYCCCWKFGRYQSVPQQTMETAA